MTIEFHCPHCSKVLKTSDDRAGRQATCPGCGSVITVPDAPANVIDQIPLVEEGVYADDVPVDQPAPDEQKACPACGEQISTTTIRCRFCGEVFISSNSRRHRTSVRREMRPFPPGEVISEAWRLFTERMFFCVWIFVVFSFLTYLVSGICAAPFFLSSMLFENGNYLTGILCGMLGMILSCVAFYVANYLLAGYLTIQIKVAREQRAEFGDLFSGKKFAFNMALNSLIFSMIFSIGILALVIPGLVLGLMFFLYGHALVDENRPGIDSLTRAKELTDGNWGSLLIIFAVAGASIFAGWLMCHIGALVAIPFSNLLYAVAYDRMTYQTRLKSPDVV